MIQTTTRCIVCRSRVELEDVNSRWCASCECLDYSIDAPMGTGATPEDALDEWRKASATYRVPFQPSSLASFIVPPAPEGWGYRVTPGHQTRAVSLERAQELADRGDSLPIPIFYGPIEGQKAVNQ